MIDLDVRFVQDKTEEGTLVFKIEPPLDAFVQYGEDSNEIAAVTAAAIGGSKFAIRQLLAREVEAALIRKQNGEESNGKDASKTASDAMAAYRKGNVSSKPKEQAKEKIAVDFFGRPVVKKAAAPPTGPMPLLPGSRAWKAAQAQASGNACTLEDVSDLTEASEQQVCEFDVHAKSAKQVKVFYRFHEGYSNAVRRPVKMSDLL